MNDTTNEKLFRTALVYDFDGTLAQGNMQEHSFFPQVLNVEKEAFWDEVSQLKKTENADQNLIYLYLMLQKAKESNVEITRELLTEHGKTIPLFEGVDTWFDRINAFGRSKRLVVEHYVISAGNEEIIEGSVIRDKFRKIFASKYLYEDNIAVWPAVSINYTSKTQFLFRINKGILDHWNNEALNRWVPLKERPLPFSRMIYFGDGDTDIPSMKMVRQQGGQSIAVFDPKKWNDPSDQKKVYNLISEDRAHHVAPGDYSEGSLLEITVKGILGRIAREDAGYRE